MASLCRGSDRALEDMRRRDICARGSGVRIGAHQEGLAVVLEPPEDPEPHRAAEEGGDVLVRRRDRRHLQPPVLAGARSGRRRPSRPCGGRRAGASSRAGPHMRAAESASDATAGRKSRPDRRARDTPKSLTASRCRLRRAPSPPPPRANRRRRRAPDACRRRRSSSSPPSPAPRARGDRPAQAVRLATSSRRSTVLCQRRALARAAGRPGEDRGAASTTSSGTRCHSIQRSREWRSSARSSRSTRPT